MERGGSNLSDKGLNSVDRGSKATLPLTIPRRDLSRLQRILPAAVVIIIQGGPNGAHRTDLANDTRLWEPKLLPRVGNRAAGTCVASSPDSDLEAFSHNPAHGSFAPLAFQPSAMTNCANQRFLSHSDVPPQPNSPPDNVLRSIDPPASLDLKEGVVTPPPVHGVNDEAFGYLKRVIVTPAAYPRLVEFLHFDIQSTGQKSHCVSIRRDHRNALF
ncbi:hypothetical protein Bca101_102220 [Brassica carinata]